jgi:hypothetical protein
MRRALLFATFALPLVALSLSARAAEAACTDAGACKPNQYCALPDGGPAPDGGQGACVAEVCVVNADCPGGKPVCDTLVEPHACVGCLADKDCPAPEACDPPTQTCLLPAGADAGPPDAAAPDAGPPDAGTVAPPARDAGPADAAAGVSEPDTGTLSGGACDCDLARGGSSGPAGPAALAASLALLAALRRKRSRGR